MDQKMNYNAKKNPGRGSVTAQKTPLVMTPVSHDIPISPRSPNSPHHSKNSGKKEKY